MMQFAVLVILLGFSSGAVVPSKPLTAEFSCDQFKSATCINAFLGTLGIRHFPNSSVEFFDYMHKYFDDNGLNAFSTLCTAHGLLQFCEGKQFDDCTSVRGLNELGLPISDAVAIAYYLSGVEYDCGKGFDDYYKNFDCINSVASTQANEEEDKRCQEQLKTNLHNEPDLACEYYQEFMSCITIPYKSCGDTTTSLICNSLLATFKKINPRCNDFLSCKYF